MDDHSRVSFALIRFDERGETCAKHLREAVSYYDSLACASRRVMTDNGRGYVSKAFHAACVELAIPPARTPLHAKGQWQGRALREASLREGALCQAIHQLSERRLAPIPSSLQLASATLPTEPHSPMSRIPFVSNLLELNNQVEGYPTNPLILRCILSRAARITRRPNAMPGSSTVRAITHPVK